MSFLPHPQSHAYKHGESTRRDVTDSKWIRQHGNRVVAELCGCFDNWNKSVFFWPTCILCGIFVFIVAITDVLSKEHDS